MIANLLSAKADGGNQIACARPPAGDRRGRQARGRTITARQDIHRDGQRDWDDHFWWSHDDIRLHARIYAGPEGGDALPPVLCLPGLSRNARDFEALAPHVAARRKVIAVEFRGRGESAYARDPMTYVPLTYVQDVALLLDELGISRFAAIGTSLGGLVSMLFAATQPGRVVGAVLNDVGPELEQAGLDRIRDYIGLGGSQPTWVHAARAYAEVNRIVYPDFDIRDWLRVTKRTHRLTAEGRIVSDYDKQIAAPLRVPGEEAEFDLWPVYRALGEGPVLILRGALSDILAREVAERMAAALPRARLVEVPRVGHAPTLDEAEARAAIDAWVAELPTA